MKTFRISEIEIKDLKPVSVGYKIFKNDWSTRQGYNYADENGNVLNTIHKVDGDIMECQWGLHFSENPQDCFNFHEPLQWNKFAKVEAYGKVIKSKDGKKSVAQILKIIKVYKFDEFIGKIQEELQYSNRSGGVNWSDGVNRSYGVKNCEGISRSIFCYKKSGKLMIFNKKVAEERFNEVWERINGFNWYPKFNNAEELKGNLAWYETNIPEIAPVPNEVARSYMPIEMKKYILSLPEYNEKLFNKITGKIKND